MNDGRGGTRATLRGKNYFTVPYRGWSRESAGFEEIFNAPIESRYWCFVQYCVLQRPTLEYLVVHVAGVGKRLDEREVANGPTDRRDGAVERPSSARQRDVRGRRP